MSGPPIACIINKASNDTKPPVKAISHLFIQAYRTLIIRTNMSLEKELEKELEKKREPQSYLVLYVTHGLNSHLAWSDKNAMHKLGHAPRSAVAHPSQPASESGGIARWKVVRARAICLGRQHIAHYY